MFFFFNDTATTEIYTLSLHDALPIYLCHDNREIPVALQEDSSQGIAGPCVVAVDERVKPLSSSGFSRSEEHTSELQSRQYLVCRLLLEKKKNKTLSISIKPLIYINL